MKNESLIKAREAAGLTQRELAEKCGVSQSMIARIESGEREPRCWLMLRISQALGESVGYLFYGQNDDQRSLQVDKST